MRATVILLLSLASMASHAAGDARTIVEFNGMKVGSLLEKETGSGCGCSFYTPPEKKSHGADILAWEDGDIAHMFIAGGLVALKVESPLPFSEHLKQGISLRLSSPSTQVQGNLVSTFVCSAGSESCEVTEFTGTLSVQSGAQKAAIPVWGSCGC